MKNEIAKPSGAITPRSLKAEPNLINLEGYYNHSLNDDIHHKPGNTLSDLPAGIQVLGEIPFDIRGLIQLSGLNSTDITTLIYPQVISDIPVGLRAQNIHFLHGSSWNIEAESAEIGKYVIHYANDLVEEIKLVYKVNIWDWWGQTNDDNPKKVWQGTNERTRERGLSIRLFQLSFQNPHPEKEIKSISLHSNNQGPGPFVVAITVL
jgi:hypothetical protein